MSYSIRFRLPVPTAEGGAGGLVRFLMAIRHVAVDRFDGTMQSWRNGRSADDGIPADPLVHVLLTFDDSVNPLEVTRALDRLYEQAEDIALGTKDVE